MKQVRRSGQAALTLVEVLIAIGLLGMVVGAIYSSWTAILRASKVAQDAAAAAHRERMAVQVIEQALNSACLYTANWRWYAFVAENGPDAMLSFVARLPESFPRAGKFGDLNLRRVSFSLEPGPDGQKQLVLRQSPLLMEIDEDEENHPLVLARNVKEFKLEFWDARTGEWMDEWRDTNQLPRIVMVALTVGRPGADTSTQAGQLQLVRFVNLPCRGVQPNWQAPGLPPAGPRPGQPPTPRTPAPGQTPPQMQP
ncbi:MAG: prepilin-type N-terminal cleavage/methylation domain-containing protein, partial [Verrucomicrobiae bacterium]|nr:prepilin-type N-terminal cleavage/methylation domain-containing protein [Verrucomicrobiae bacterium]